MIGVLEAPAAQCPSTPHLGALCLLAGPPQMSPRPDGPTSQQKGPAVFDGQPALASGSSASRLISPPVRVRREEPGGVQAEGLLAINPQGGGGQIQPRHHQGPGSPIHLLRPVLYTAGSLPLMHTGISPRRAGAQPGHCGWGLCGLSPLGGAGCAVLQALVCTPLSTTVPAAPKCPQPNPGHLLGSTGVDVL
ncbi:hypothetical protein NDU88_006509 [Pleurodeles waltl]|uniref:Uncharacterized protein n=1 Tax=Pleurodeles waltl TaxID=8319 RepID=A0AAV7RMQ0_PLEWA|nr:hypothetical protein NDU88_006509 [Pleurodeles waltl]